MIFIISMNLLMQKSRLDSCCFSLCSFLVSVQSEVFVQRVTVDAHRDPAAAESCSVCSLLNLNWQCEFLRGLWVFYDCTHPGIVLYTLLLRLMPFNLLMRAGEARPVLLSVMVVKHRVCTVT